MTEMTTGFGASLAFGAATGNALPAFASDTYTVVPKIEELTVPSTTRDTEEFNTLDVKSKQRLVGSISVDQGEATLVRDFESVAQDVLRDNANAAVAVRRNWRFQLPNAGAEIHYCVGYVSKFKYAGLNNNGRIQFALEITVDGDLVIVP